MSRVSNNPISVPENVEIFLTEQDIKIKGPLGVLEYPIVREISVNQIDNLLKIKANSNSQHANALSGTFRALIANMVHGVSKGFEKKLQLVGVGYRAQANANKLSLTLGFSHPIDFEIPNGIKI